MSEFLLLVVCVSNFKRFGDFFPRGVQPLCAGDTYVPLKWVTFEGIFPNLEYQLGGNFPNLGWKIQENSLTKVLQQGIFRLDVYITNHDA